MYVKNEKRGGNDKLPEKLDGKKTIMFRELDQNNKS